MFPKKTHTQPLTISFVIIYLTVTRQSIMCGAPELGQGILASPPVSRNTLIHAHVNSHTVVTCRIGLDWLVLPAPDIWELVELILIYQNWGCEFFFGNILENFELTSDDANINTNDWVDYFLRWYLYWKPKNRKSPGMYQNPVEVFQASRKKISLWNLKTY